MGIDFSKHLKQLESKEELPPVPDYVPDPNKEHVELPVGPLDRFGSCPECKLEWDDGDILERLRNIVALRDKTDEEIVNLAYHGYGYIKDNPKRFSKVIAICVMTEDIAGETKLHELSNEEFTHEPIVNPNFYMCPRCRNVWNSDTSKHYINLHQAKKELYESISGKSADRTEI